MKTYKLFFNPLRNIKKKKKKKEIFVFTVLGWETNHSFHFAQLYYALVPPSGLFSGINVEGVVEEISVTQYSIA